MRGLAPPRPASRPTSQIDRLSTTAAISNQNGALNRNAINPPPGRIPPKRLRRPAGTPQNPHAASGPRSPKPNARAQPIDPRQIARHRASGSNGISLAVHANVNAHALDAAHHAVVEPSLPRKPGSPNHNRLAALPHPRRPTVNVAVPAGPKPRDNDLSSSNAATARTIEPSHKASQPRPAGAAWPAEIPTEPAQAGRLANLQLPVMHHAADNGAPLARANEHRRPRADQDARPSRHLESPSGIGPIHVNDAGTPVSATVRIVRNGLDALKANMPHQPGRRGKPAVPVRDPNQHVIRQKPLRNRPQAPHPNPRTEKKRTSTSAAQAQPRRAPPQSQPHRTPPKANPVPSSSPKAASRATSRPVVPFSI